MKTIEQITKELKAKFNQSDLECRILQSGEKNGKIWAKLAFYVDSRAVQDRLDEVVGIGNWKVDNQFIQEGSKMIGVLSSLSLKINGEWITKQDGSDLTDIEAFKGGISSALKRSASLWGVGRYLYEIGEVFAETSKERQNGWNYAKSKDLVFYWKAPNLPAKFLPEAHQKVLKESIQENEELDPSGVTKTEAKRIKADQLKEETKLIALGKRLGKHFDSKITDDIIKNAEWTKDLEAQLEVLIDEHNKKKEEVKKIEPVETKVIEKDEDGEFSKKRSEQVLKEMELFSRATKLGKRFMTKINDNLEANDIWLAKLEKHIIGLEDEAKAKEEEKKQFNSMDKYRNEEPAEGGQNYQDEE